MPTRRAVLQATLTTILARPLWAMSQGDRFDAAAKEMESAVASGLVKAATFHIESRGVVEQWHFGQTPSMDAMFLLGSISKPICIAALLRLYDNGEFSLDDAVVKFVPEFREAGRERVTLRHLLTHTSGLPDQLANNSELRSRHAGLADFVSGTIRTPLQFPAGTRYQYSSMGILLAMRVAEVISGTGMVPLVEETVLQPLGMTRSALGRGRFELADFVACQTEFAAPESGAGDASAKGWDWNSAYWRSLGAPWGGLHASAPDVARFLKEFLAPAGKLFRRETAREMIRNQNPDGFTPRGLGFAVGTSLGGAGCSERTYGHTGSTGTLAWADPDAETVCVVLTSLPGRAVPEHPRTKVSNRVAASLKRQESR